VGFGWGGLGGGGGVGGVGWVVGGGGWGGGGFVGGGVRAPKKKELKKYHNPWGKLGKGEIEKEARGSHARDA